MLVAGALAYGWLSISPLPWRADVSVAVIALGLPATMVALREQSTIAPTRLLAGALRWRIRAPLLLAASDRGVSRGGLRLDAPAGEEPVELASLVELPWTEEERSA